MQKYIIKQRIGFGSFGQVFQIIDTKKNERLALKRIKTHFNNEQQVKDLIQVKILSRLKHPNIIDLKDAIYDKDTQKANLIFEYCHTSLLKKFCNVKKERPPEIEIKKVIFEIASALYFIHAKNYIHRDLKPQNILLQENQFQGKVYEVAKLIDFGISQRADHNPLTYYVGTRWYRAPQLLIKMKSYTKAVDIFSLGCIMAQLYNLKILFQGKNASQQLLFIIKTLGTPTKDSWPQFSNWCKFKGIIFGKYEKSEDPIILRAKPGDLAEDLIQKMLVMNPKNRISAADILKHPYFNEVRGEIQLRQYAGKPLKFSDSPQKGQSQMSQKCESQRKKAENGSQSRKSQILAYMQEKQMKTTEKIQQGKIQQEQIPTIVTSEVKYGQKKVTMKLPETKSPYKKQASPYYSPYNSKLTKNPNSQKKFDYFQTYVVNRSNQRKNEERIKTTYEHKQNSESRDKTKDSESFHIKYWDTSK